MALGLLQIIHMFIVPCAHSQWPDRGHDFCGRVFHRFQERWAKKKADDAARMEALEKAQEERRRARELEEAAAAGAGTSLSTVEAGKQ